MSGRKAAKYKGFPHTHKQKCEWVVGRNGREKARDDKMRKTVEILAELEENGRPEYEELRMACLVQKTLLYFIHNDIKRLLKGGIAAAVTKTSYPKDHAELGIPTYEWKALHSDPEQYLGKDHIPGTPEWEKMHAVAVKIFEKALKDHPDGARELAGIGNAIREADPG